jgi:hypothetical protein
MLAVTQWNDEGSKSSTDSLYELRILANRYEDVIKSGVRIINQKSAIYRAENRSHKKENILQ